LPGLPGTYPSYQRRSLAATASQSGKTQGEGVPLHFICQYHMRADGLLEVHAHIYAEAYTKVVLPPLFDSCTSPYLDAFRLLNSRKYGGGE
jgi:hypothetical protein